jgi:uncharacterized repeat protein (TIGR03803 family)
MRRILGTPAIAEILAVVLVGLGLVPATWAAGKFKVLHDFGATGDGSTPGGALLLDSQGNLYGGTAGGPGEYGYGTVYKLSSQADGTWSETILHTFSAGSGGANPWGSLIFDGSGNLYGTMPLGTNYIGGVFELSPGSGGWAYSVLYTESSGPGLLLDKLGNLYGQMAPGKYSYSAVAELSPGSGGWTYTPLYSFCSGQGCPDGDGEPAPPIWDGKGNLYGTTSEGGIGRPPCWIAFGCGVIFKMTPNGDGTWTYHVLHRFASSSTDGQTPGGGLVMDAAGNLYGNTGGGGVHSNGTIFKFSFSGGHWKKTVLYDFPNCADGCYPYDAIVFDKAGNLYGGANGGLPDCDGYQCGVVFKLSPQKSGPWKYSVVHKFTAADGEYPLGLVIDGKGHLFGTTQAFGKYHFGTAFEIIP